MAKFVRHSKVSTNPNEYILNKKKRLKLFFEYQGKFKFTPVFTMQPNSNIWSYCTSYTWMEHFFIICQQLCSFNAYSDLVLSDGCNVYKMRNDFLLLSPIYPSFSHCILPENISQARSLQPNFTKYCSGYLSS